MTNSDQPERDQTIHDALAERAVPEHRDGFFDELTTRLDAEAPSNSEATPQHPGAAGARNTSTKHHWRYIWIAPVAAASLVAVLLAGSLDDGEPSSELTHPSVTAPDTNPPSKSLEPALASDVVQLASAKVASVTALSGVVREQTFAWKGKDFSNQASQTTTEFRVTAKGDSWSRCECAYGTVETSFDAATGEERSVTRTPDGKNSATVITRSQDTDRATHLTRLGILTSSLRSMAQAKDPTLKQVTYNERPAWQLEANTSIDLLGLGPDHYVITVDKETSFPVHLVGTREGRPFEEATATELEFNPTFTPSQMQVTVPPSAEVFRRDAGYERVSLPEVKTVVGYEPFVPSHLPTGFSLSSITANRNAGASGPEGSNPNNVNLVVLTYRRGLETLQVTTRSSSNGGNEWNDPHGYEGEPPHTVEKVTIKDGAFADLTANVIATSTSKPHLWLLGSRWMLTVVGDASRDELVKVAESVLSPSATDHSINPATTLPSR